MPPAMITCSVCGQSVMKSQTYATGENSPEGIPLRACKSHEGVAQKAEELKKQHEKDIKRPEQKRHDIFGEAKTGLEKVMCDAQWADTHCWLCGREGVSIQDAHLLLLIDREKLELKGENWLAKMMSGDLAKDMHDRLWSDNRCVFVRFSIDKPQLLKIMEWKGRFKKLVLMGIEITGTVQLCHECQVRTGVEYKMPEPKMPNLQALSIIGAAYETSGFKDRVKSIAAAELIKETERN